MAASYTANRSNNITTRDIEAEEKAMQNHNFNTKQTMYCLTPMTKSPSVQSLLQTNDKKCV